MGEADGSLMLHRATIDESDFAFAVKEAAFRPYIEQSLAWDDEAQRRQHQRRFARNDYRIIAVDGRAVGVMSLACDDHCVRVNQLFVLPEHQGQGVGARCMELIVAAAGDLDLPVRLRVMKVNPRAKAFYERLDFTVTGGTGTHYSMERKP